MYEQKLYKDLPSRGKFHSCIISSFSFDYHFFDSQIRRQLHSKGINNIILLCDANILEQGFGNFSFGTNYFLNDYTITPIESRGVFHPKISLFFGDKDIMMHLGSGNLTSGGLGKNHELFSTFSTDNKEDPQFNIINVGVSFLTSFLKGKTGFVQQQLNWIIKHCDLIQKFDPPKNSDKIKLKNDAFVSFLLNGDRSIYEQMMDIIPTSEIEEITIVSPFFDESGMFVNRLQDDFQNASLNIFVQEGKTLLPQDIRAFGRVRFLDWNETDRAQKRFKSGERFNHSKIFVFKSVDETYIMHGSPNATGPAFGIHPYFKNDEACLIFQYHNNQELPDLGLNSKKELSVESLSRSNYLPNPERTINKTKSLIKVLGADKYLTHIRATFSKAIEDNQSIIFLDATGEVLKSIQGLKTKSKEIQFSFEDNPELKTAVALYVSIGEDKISNHAFINELEYLWKCDPSKENRKFQKLLSNIQIGNISEFDILNHLTSILKSQDDSGRNKSAALKVKSENASSKVHLSYEEAKALEEEERHELHMLSSSKQVWDAMNVLFKFIKTEKEEKSIDQEEEGPKEDGGETEEENNKLYDKTKVFRDLKDFERMRGRMINSFEKYITYLKVLLEKEHYEITSSELCYFLVLYYQLVFISNKKYNLKLSEDHEKEKTLLPLNGFIKEFESFNSISIRILGHFLLLMNKFEYHNYEDDFSVKEFEVYKKQCSILIYFALLLHSKINNHYHVEWWSLLWLNCSSSLSEFDSISFDKLIESFDDKVHFDLADLDREVVNILAEVDQIVSQTKQDINLRSHINLDYFGVSKIIRKMPHIDPKSIELSFPGINYDEDKKEFVYPLFYNFGRGDFLKHFHK